MGYGSNSTTKYFDLASKTLTNIWKNNISKPDLVNHTPPFLFGYYYSFFFLFSFSPFCDGIGLSL